MAYLVFKTTLWASLIFQGSHACKVSPESMIAWIFLHKLSRFSGCCKQHMIYVYI